MSNTIEIFEDKETLLRYAQTTSDKADEPYKESIYLYFIARYYVSVYEAKFGVIPI